MLTTAAARALLGGFGAGWLEASEVLARPLVAVDVSGAGQLGTAVPAGFPAVVVAVCGRSAPAGGATGADVALTAAPDPPAPWVHVPDVAAEVAALAERVTAAPGAAVTLVEVLRAGRGASIDEGLIIESLAYSMLQCGPEFARWQGGRRRAPVRAPSRPPVRVSRHDGAVEIVLDRPEVHNAYSRSMRDHLCDALGAVAPDERVVLTGAGPSFCSGGDLDEFGTAPDPVSAHLVRTAQSPARLLAALSGRVEARLHGVCAGSGIELPAFAGSVRAEHDTRIWLPELGMGLIPGAGGTVSVARRIGAARTAWMALSGRPVDAVTALRWGLVDEVSGQGDRRRRDHVVHR